MTNEIIEIIQRIEKKIDYTSYSHDLELIEFPYSWTIFLFFERFHISLQSCKEFVNKLDGNPFYDMPIGLIVRTMILDSLTIIEIFANAKKVDDVKMKICKLLVDNFISFFNSQSGNDNCKLLKDKMGAKYSLLLKEINVKDIQEILDKKEKFRFKSPSKMYSTIKDSKYHYFAYGYDLYIYYSKYEHFGAIYPLISRLDLNFKIKVLVMSFNYIEDVISFFIDSIFEAEKHSYK